MAIQNLIILVKETALFHWKTKTISITVLSTKVMKMHSCAHAQNCVALYINIYWKLEYNQRNQSTVYVCRVLGFGMMTSSNGNILRVIGPFAGSFPSQRPVTWTFLKFFFICTWINGWVNNREAGDLRRHRGHNGVIVMARLLQCQWSIMGLCSLRRHRLIGKGIHIINLRRSSDRHRFIMGIPLPIKRRLFSE